MSTQQQRPLLYPNHKHFSQLTLVFSQLTLVFLVVIGSLLMGLVSLILTETSEANFLIPAEAELWTPLGEASQ